MTHDDAVHNDAAVGSSADPSVSAASLGAHDDAASLSSKDTAERHFPVLLERCVSLFADSVESARSAGRQPVLVDCTLGMGGHSEAMLERYPDALLIGIDRDTMALSLAGKRLARFADRTHLVHAVYSEVDDIVHELSLPGVDGVLFDLGVSSLQLDERERGFAYSYDAPLDMRMDRTEGETAADLVNTLSEEELVRILRVYGEEKFAGRIARSIVKDRAEKPFETTGELVASIRKVVPAAAARTAGHPAKRTFQALRIAVNEELDVLEEAIPASMDVLNVGGRVVVMSYHSLEDKITKKFFASAAKSSAPAGFPVELEEHKARFKTITRGTEQPTEQEISENPRAASARLRATERTLPRSSS